MGELRRTPLYDKHVKQNAKIVDFAGFEMPIQYTSIIQEHEAVRSNVGMFDVSHMGEILVRGSNALTYLEHVCTNNVSTIEVGQVRYSFLCYDNGHVVDDILIYRFGDDLYCLVVNASNIEKDYDWLSSHLIDGVELENVSDRTSEIALQGPQAEAVLQTMTDVDLSQIGFFRFVWGNVLGKHTLISRTGYTGEDGFELYTDNESVLDLWDYFLKEGVAPIGLGARDTLRFEASLPLYGHEISDTITPLEAGFKRFVDFDKSFIGKPALERPRTRKLVGIEIHDRGIARATYPVFDVNHNEIGVVTTGYMLGNRTLALALVPATMQLGDSVLVAMRDKRLAGTIISTKFKDKNYKK
jgi:aminomethyltransferase